MMNARTEMKRLFLSMQSVNTYPIKLYSVYAFPSESTKRQEIAVNKSNPRCQRTPMFIATKRLPSRDLMT